MTEEMRMDYQLADMVAHTRSKMFEQVNVLKNIYEAEDSAKGLCIHEECKKLQRLLDSYVTIQEAYNKFI